MKKSLQNNNIKNIVLLFILMYSSLACNSQKKQKTLESLYLTYKKESSVKIINEFFYAFPSSFSEFQKLYGYDDKKGESIYYKFGLEHITLFYKASESIEKKIFASKVIAISSNGKWDADAVNYFQEGLRNYFFKESKSVIDILNKKSNNEIEGFWYFYSDGPHFDELVHKKTVTLLKDNPILLSCYEKVIKQIKKDSLH